MTNNLIMNNKPLVSIVVNFYKSERYIPKLIKSIQNQSYENFELICVNDCSPLNDKLIVERFMQRDKRIHLINNKINLGICKSKRVGIEVAKGKYIMFVDGDDWFEKDAIKSMIEPAEQYGLDLVIMNHSKVLPALHYKKKIRSNVDCYSRPIYGQEVMDKYFINFFGGNIFAVPYWGKLYNLSMLNNSGITTPSDDIAEDFIFNMRVFPHVKSLMFVDYFGYNWRWGGITSGKNNHFWTGQNMLKKSNEVYIESTKLIEKYNYP